MSGYKNFSKSNNAVEAEREGLFPRSVIAKKLGVKTIAIKKLMEPMERHHTSSWYNVTDYYSLEEALEKIEELKKFSKNFDSNVEVFENCAVEYLEWSGTRKHPKANKIKMDGCRVEKKGEWCLIVPREGKSFCKNIKTNGFSFSIAGRKEFNDEKI